MSRERIMWDALHAARAALEQALAASPLSVAEAEARGADAYTAMTGQKCQARLDSDGRLVIRPDAYVDHIAFDFAITPEKPDAP